MTLDLAFSLMIALPVAAALVLLARLGLRGGRLAGLTKRRFVCPERRETVTCELWRDLRISQWKGVRSCTAFDPPERLRCEAACAAIMNRGAPLEGEGGRI